MCRLWNDTNVTPDFVDAGARHLPTAVWKLPAEAPRSTPPRVAHIETTTCPQTSGEPGRVLSSVVSSA